MCVAVGHVLGVDSRAPKEPCTKWGAHWRHPANTIVSCVFVCVAVGRPLVSVHVTGAETVIRGGEIQLVCKASGSTAASGVGGRLSTPRSVLWVKDGRRLSSQVRLGLLSLLICPRRRGGVLSDTAICPSVCPTAQLP